MMNNAAKNVTIPVTNLSVQYNYFAKISYGLRRLLMKIPKRIKTFKIYQDLKNKDNTNTSYGLINLFVKFYCTLPLVLILISPNLV